MKYFLTEKKLNPEEADFLDISLSVIFENDERSLKELKEYFNKDDFEVFVNLLPDLKKKA